MPPSPDPTVLLQRTGLACRVQAMNKLSPVNPNPYLVYQDSKQARGKIHSSLFTVEVEEKKPFVLLKARWFSNAFSLIPSFGLRHHS